MAKEKKSVQDLIRLADKVQRVITYPEKIPSINQVKASKESDQDLEAVKKAKNNTVLFSEEEKKLLLEHVDFFIEKAAAGDAGYSKIVQFIQPDAKLTSEKEEIKALGEKDPEFKQVKDLILILNKLSGEEKLLDTTKLDKVAKNLIGLCKERANKKASKIDTIILVRDFISKTVTNDASKPLETFYNAINDLKDVTKVDAKGWFELIKTDKKALKFLQKAEVIEAEIGRAPKNYQEALQAYIKITYPRSQEINKLVDVNLPKGITKEKLKQFTVLCAESLSDGNRTPVLEKAYNKALDFLQNKSATKLKTEEKLPDIIIDGDSREFLERFGKRFNAGSKEFLERFGKRFNIDSKEFLERFGERFNVDSKEFQESFGNGLNVDKEFQEKFREPFKGYVMTKLPPDDVRSLVLGDLTNCCQSVGGLGAAVAMDGMSNPNSGFYVIIKKNPKATTFEENIKNGRIVAQSFAWVDGNGGLVFDSFERLGESNNNLLYPFYSMFAEKAVGGYGFDKVTIGKGGNTPNARGMYYLSAEQPLIFPGIAPYADASTQWTIIDTALKIDIQHPAVELARLIDSTDDINIIKGYIDAYSNRLDVKDFEMIILLTTTKKSKEAVEYLLNKFPDILPEHQRLALKGAVENGHIDMVKILLERCLKITPEDQGSALHVAAAGGHIDMVKTLLEKCPKITLEDQGSALKAAAAGDHINMVKTLLEKCPKITLEDQGSALHVAAAGGHIDMVKTLLKEYRKITPEDQNSALRVAVTSGKIDIIKILLKECPKITPSARGYALIKAAENRRIDIVKTLLEEGQNTTTIDITDQGSALMKATKNASIEIVKILLDKFSTIPVANQGSALKEAAENGYIDIVKTLLDKCLNIKQKDQVLAFRLAAENGHIDIVEALLEKFPNITLEDQGPALIGALNNGFTEIAKALLDKCQNINSRDQGFALIKAGSMSYIDIVETLLKRNSLGIPEAAKSKALQDATNSKDLAIVKCLVENGRMEPKSLEAALQTSVEEGQKEIVEYLIDKSHNISPKAKYAALQEAIKSNKPEVVGILVKNCRQEMVKSQIEALEKITEPKEIVQAIRENLKPAVVKTILAAGRRNQRLPKTGKGVQERQAPSSRTF